MARKYGPNDDLFDTLEKARKERGRDLRPIFVAFLAIEAIPDGFKGTQAKKGFDAAGVCIEALWDLLTNDEQYFHESGHEWPTKRIR